MCRRLLVQPSSDTAETRQTDPHFNPDISIGELERQIRQHLDLLRTRFEGVQLPFTSSNHMHLLPTRDDNAGDRNEYSGMYS